MVQVVENWTDILATVLGVSTAALGDFAEVRVRIDEVAAVSGFANLLTEAKGTETEILARESVIDAASLKVGDRIRCRVRFAGGNRIFLHDEYLAKA
jgi:hypothetical protein